MNVIRKVYRSLIKRKLQRFNIDNRAERVLAKPKTRAPLHESTVDSYKELEKEFPEELLAQKQKNEDLVQMMHGMVANPDRLNDLSTRSLPSRNRQAIDDNFQTKTEVAPEGKVLLTEALQFIGDYQFKPEPPSALDIARQYKLDLDDVEATLKHFRSFKIYYAVDEELLKELEEAKETSPEPQIAASAHSEPTRISTVLLQEGKTRTKQDSQETLARAAKETQHEEIFDFHSASIEGMKLTPKQQAQRRFAEESEEETVFKKPEQNTSTVRSNDTRNPVNG